MTGFDDQVALPVARDLAISDVGTLQSISRIPTIGGLRPLAGGFLAHPPARGQANTVLDEGFLRVGVNPRVDHLVADRAVSVGGSIHGGVVCRTPARASGALIWRGV